MLKQNVTIRLPRVFAAAGLILLTLLLSACATPVAGDSYRRYETQRAQSVELGVIEATRPVQIQGRDSGVGTVGGAALGGLAGSTVGRGNGSVAGAIAGAIIGGVAGTAIERDANRRNGVEITVRLDNGRMLAVVQEDVGEVLRPGDRVRVLSDGYATRITR